MRPSRRDNTNSQTCASLSGLRMISTLWIRLSTTSTERTLQTRPPRAATRAPRGCPPRPRPGRAAGEVGIRPAPGETGRRTSLLREANLGVPPRNGGTALRMFGAWPMLTQYRAIARPSQGVLRTRARDVVDAATHDVAAVLDAAWALVAATRTVPSKAPWRGRSFSMVEWP